jgi:cobalamin biosynthesis protein CbiG
MTGTRMCGCGCGASLEGRRRQTRYLDGRCRVRAHRARNAVTRPQTSSEAGVTVSEAQESRSRHVLTNAEAGIGKGIAPGPARLLRALVRHGLAQEHLRAGAALVLALDEGAGR